MVGIVLSAPRVEEVAVSTALYRRYRPETFAEVIGQEHVTEPLMVALEKNRVNHAYLFSPAWLRQDHVGAYFGALLELCAGSDSYSVWCVRFVP